MIKTTSKLMTKHGVTLTPLDITHLELLREWRNSDFVQQFMFYQKEISVLEQKKWFDSLETGQKYYFIISDDDGNYGCCNLNIAVDEFGVRYGEGGIFSADKSKLNSLTPIKAMCIVYSWAFEYHDVNSIKAKIRLDNKRAIRFNHGLGFRVDNETEGVTNAILTRESFESRYSKIKRVLG